MDLSGEFAELNMQTVDGSPQYGASSVHFDTNFELLWAGNNAVSQVFMTDNYSFS